VSVALVQRDPHRNRLGPALYRARAQHCTAAILEPRQKGDPDVRSARTNLPLVAEVRLDG